MGKVWSSFDGGTDGWTSEGSQSMWQRAGGDPGGYLAWSTTGDSDGVFSSARNGFLAHKSGYYSGEVSVDFLSSFDPGRDGLSLVLRGPNGETATGHLESDGSFIANTWQHYHIELDRTHLTTGGRHPASTIRDILHNPEAFQIVLAEGQTGNGGFDNITLLSRSEIAAHHVELAGPAAHFAASAPLVDHHHMPLA